MHSPSHAHTQAAALKQPKGILKHHASPLFRPTISTSSTSSSAAAAAAISRAASVSDAAAVSFDEYNLSVNESEKVPRQKITEPKTPFHSSAHTEHEEFLDHMSLDDDNNNSSDTDWVMRTTQASADSSAATSAAEESDDDECDQSQYTTMTVGAGDAVRQSENIASTEKHEKFQSKRNSFYKGEFVKLRAAVAAAAADDSDSDNDEFALQDVQPSNSVKSPQELANDGNNNSNNTVISSSISDKSNNSSSSSSSSSSNTAAATPSRHATKKHRSGEIAFNVNDA